MNQIIVPIITIHSICQKIASYINDDEIIDLINAYITQYHLDITKVEVNDNRHGWQILCDKINDFPDANKLDFIGQIVEADYINNEYDFTIEFSRIDRNEIGEINGEINLPYSESHHLFYFVVETQVIITTLIHYQI